MKNLNKSLVFSSTVLILVIWMIFKTWFMPGVISGGDFWYYFPDMLKSYSLFPYAWSWAQANGLGGSQIPFLWINTTFMLPVTLISGILHMPWIIVERLGFFFPFILFSIVSPIILYRSLFPKNTFFLLAGSFYLLNTYSLLIIGGGQVLYALSYALVPLTVWSFSKLFTSLRLSSLFIASLIFALQIITDIRVGFIVVIIISCFFIITHILFQQERNKILIKTSYFLVALFFALLLNLFWVLPLAATHQNPITQLDSAYTSVESVKYFSFARFEDTLSLLHPNWPENIFGKVYFLRPEFLIIPILAFLSLLFAAHRSIKIAEKQKDAIVFFALLALFGAFLAKGVQDPFGNVYLWLFKHMPGFSMFRDPTKWYIIIALSYSMLIPWTVSHIFMWIKTHEKFQVFSTHFGKKRFYFPLHIISILLIIASLLFLISPAIYGQLKGTLQATSIPEAYKKLSLFLSHKNTYSRTLWLPTTQRFGYNTQNHPAISMDDLFPITDTGRVNIVNSPESLKLLKEMSVQYVIVPYDSEGEIFLKDRKFSRRKYEEMIYFAKNILWLKELKGFGHLKVFEISGSKDHFWTDSANLQLVWHKISPVEYQVEGKHGKIDGRIIFSDRFDQNWVARVKGNTIHSEIYHDRYNSFNMTGVTGPIDIYYAPQQWVNIGLVISGITLVVIIGYLVYERKNKQHA